MIGPSSDLHLSTEEEQMLFASIAEEYSDSDFVLPRAPSPTFLEETSASSSSEDDDNSEEIIAAEAVTSSSAKIAKELLKLDNGFADEACTIPTEDVIGAVKMADVDELDTILANEMSKLSMEEQRKASQDVYGISTHIEEDPIYVENKLEEFRTLLNQIPDKQAYEQALYMDPDYVNNRKFHLMFLRSEKFDAEKAANKYVSFYQQKKILFGESALTRDITQDDLDDDSLKVLNSGAFQVLPNRDRADRAVVVLVPGILNNHHVTNRRRAIWYTTLKALQDEETQKHGFVFVVYIGVGDNTFKLDDLHELKKCRTYRHCLPQRFVAGHHCFDDKSHMRFMTFMQFLMGKHFRQRIKSHFGTRSETDYALQTYGIPTQCIPRDLFKLDTESHLSWLERLRVQELSGTTSTAVIVPRRFDVLFGKGRNVAQHTGNLRAAHIASMNRKAYEEAGKFGKTLVAERIVKLIKESYGRFLKMEDGGWVEVDHDTARDKISHLFRRMRETEQHPQGKAVKRRSSSSTRDTSKSSTTKTKKRPSK